MTTITPGSGSSITATTLEAYFVAAIRRLQALEKSSTYSPTNINNATSTLSDDSSSFSATVTLPLSYTTDGDGVTNFTVVDYLTAASSQFTPGTGGTITAPDIVKAIFEVALRISALEIQAVKNPQNLNTITWSINKSELGNVNQGSFSLSVSNFPLEIIDTGDSQTTKGKEYLL